MRMNTMLHGFWLLIAASTEQFTGAKGQIHEFILDQTNEPSTRVASAHQQAVTDDTPSPLVESRSMVLQLHRLPDAGFHPPTYQRRRLNAPSVNEVVPLNTGLGTHFTWVWAGTPPQRASVITDTGSSLMAIPCSGCRDCGEHTDAPFDANNSSTLIHVTCSVPTFFKCRNCAETDYCDISQSYLEGSSWSATVVEDVVFLGDEQVEMAGPMRDQFGTRFMFGCQKSETGLFITQVADGIMGLANNDNHLVAKLYKEEKIPDKLFTLCFGDNGGFMAIGAPDKSRHTSEITYSRLIKPLSKDFYAVQIKDIRIGNLSIQADPKSYTTGHFIVDSGTTDSYLPVSLSSEFRSTFQKVSKLPFAVSGTSACKGYTPDEIASLPDIQIVLEGEPGQEDMVLLVNPMQYLVKENKRYCAGIFLSESSGGVIGANLMTGRDVIFDSLKQRVGFADADCSYRRLGTNTTNTTTPAPSFSQSTNSTKPVETATAPTETQGPASTNVTQRPAATNVTQGPAATTNVTSTNPPATTSVAPTPAPLESVSTNSSPNSSTEQSSRSPSSTAKVVPSPPVLVNSSEPHLVSPTSQVTNAPLTSVGAKIVHTASGEDDHPAVLTVVGSVLACAFLGAISLALCRRKRKGTRKQHAWSRVRGEENDEEEEDEIDDLDDDDDDDDEFGLVDPTEHRQGRRSPRRKVQRSASEHSSSEEEVKDAEDTTGSRRMGQVAVDVDDDNGNVDDDDEDDDFFDKRHSPRHHDTRVLESL